MDEYTLAMHEEMGNKPKCYPEIIEAIKTSIQTAEKFKSEEPYIIKDNKVYTLKQIVEEMENNTDFGLEMQQGIFKLTINLLMRNKEQL